jgi:energy-coupling factor transporter ATP-binding protein EcfA2
MLSPFESYNARFVDPQTIAETFVLREAEFRVLCEQNNTLLVGPRGSGKTTLLKMLKVGAQRKWKSRREAMTLRRFAFAPIYVGADRQFDLIAGGVKSVGADDDILELLSKCLLSARVKFSCLEAAREITDPQLENIEGLSHQRVIFSRDQEREVAQSISRTWDFAEPVQSFLEARAALQLQISEVNRIVELMKYGKKLSLSSLIEEKGFLSHDPIHSCLVFIDAFNATINQYDKVWALCIDELEIMPAHLQDYLFSCFRSIDQRIVLKLATSPFSKLTWERTVVDRPMEGHDFTPINLSFARKQDARRFTARLFDALIRSEGHQKSTKRGPDVLGRSPIGDASSQSANMNLYKPPNGEHYKRFAELRAIDSGFRDFLAERNIDLERISEASESQRAGQVRKYIWQVAIRLEFGPNAIFRRKDQTLSTRAPSRKKIPEVYLGYDSLLTICEGNPRTTIGLLRPMARKFSGENHKVDFDFQGAQLQSAIAKYMSLLSTIPVEYQDGSRKNYSLIDVLDGIGEYLSDQVNSNEFKSEPSLSIRMDSKASPRILEAIGNAMNQGAFVMVSDDKELFDFGSLPGSRLRLSYMLCPRYRLPLIFGQPVNLSTVLKIEGVSRGRPLSIRDLFEND